MVSTQEDRWRGRTRFCVPLTVAALTLGACGAGNGGKNGAVEVPVASATTTSTPTAATVTTTVPTTVSRPRATTTTTGKRPVTSTLDLSKIRYHGDTTGCSNTPVVGVPRPWQTSAPRTGQTIVNGETTQIGLRNKQGDLTLTATATVIDPAGQPSSASRPLTGSDWAYLVYGQDFPNATTAAAGTYTIVWHQGDAFLACDGFTVTAAG